jgi:hypothetical protein
MPVWRTPQRESTIATRIRAPCVAMILVEDGASGAQCGECCVPLRLDDARPTSEQNNIQRIDCQGH